MHVYRFVDAPTSRLMWIRLAPAGRILPSAVPRFPTSVTLGTRSHARALASRTQPQPPARANPRCRRLGSSNRSGANEWPGSFPQCRFPHRVHYRRVAAVPSRLRRSSTVLSTGERPNRQLARHQNPRARGSRIPTPGRSPHPRRRENGRGSLHDQRISPSLAWGPCAGGGVAADGERVQEIADCRERAARGCKGRLDGVSALFGRSRGAQLRARSARSGLNELFLVTVRLRA
jgi:hypothetical protein